ncbi:hypothetical protein [Calothrix sp. NIES-2100]
MRSPVVFEIICFAIAMQLSFYDFKPDLEFFGDRILPLMKQASLRL